MVAKSISYRRVVGRRRSTRHLLTYGTGAKRFSAKSVSIHCNAEWRADWVCQSYVALGSGDGWWEEPIRGTRNRPVTGECITTGPKAWEPSWFELWLSCCSMIPEVTKIQTDPSPSNLRAIRCYEKAGFERQGTVTTPDVQPCTWFKHARHSSERSVA